MAGTVYNPLAKVYYRPIEAAIRWTGLARHEHRILSVLKTRLIPEESEFPEWPALRLNAERIYDGINNNELPHGNEGVTVQRRSRVGPLNLTVRHVDLKVWMARYYPDQRPAFLFSPSEQELLPPTISADALKALTIERAALRIRVRQLNQDIARLNDELARNRVDTSNYTRAATGDASENARALTTRGETTYLNIVGGLLDVMFGRSPSGHPYSSFTSQEALISTVVAIHGDKLGISKRTLEQKFAAARRTIADS